MDLQNLGQLKVADLKQCLKQRGLSLVGNKSDLVQRLAAALVQESTIKQLDQVVNPNNTTIKASKVEIDEDAILGDDDDTPSIGKNVDTLIQNEDLLLSESAIETTTAMATNISSNMTKTSNITPKSNPVSHSTSNSDDTSKNVPSKQLIKNKPITSEERKQMRMLKFADPKLINRAERFGIANKVIEPTETGKLLQRSQRFGEVVSSKAKTLEERERLERRKERFGVSTNSTAKVPTTINSGKSPAPENILKRQERFGIVEKPVAITATGNVFKRRRHAF